MPGTMSVKGLYDYDNSLFTGMVLPSALDQSVMINYIIAECADLEVSITNWETLKVMIESWSISRKHSWERMYESTIQDYNMIHNFDRYEDWTDNSNGTGTGKNSAQVNKAAYNKTDPVLAEKQTTDATTNTTTHNTHKGHLYGNIGVTTAAQMLTEERKLAEYDVYMAITDEFKRKFCLCVY